MTPCAGSASPIACEAIQVATTATAVLKDSSGNSLTGGIASYYAAGWHTIGATGSAAVDVQMLRGHYSFAMTHLGTRQQLNGDAVSSTTRSVTFQAETVHSASGEAVIYYDSGWRPFTQDMQLLQGGYTLHFVTHNANTKTRGLPCTVGTCVWREPVATQAPCSRTKCKAEVFPASGRQQSDRTTTFPIRAAPPLSLPHYRRRVWRTRHFPPGC